MKKFKGLVAMLLMLMLLVPSIPINAAVTDQNSSNGGGGAEGNGDKGDAEEGTKDLTGKDGALPSKTGYIMYVTEEKSLVGEPVFVTTWGGMPFSTSGSPVHNYLSTRIGGVNVRKVKGGAVVWGFEPFDTSSGHGDAVRSFLENPYINGEIGAVWVMHNYLGFDLAKIDDLFSKDNTYLHVEAVMWAGHYEGSRHAGEVIVGTAKNWAERTKVNNYLARYTHGNLPNSLVYDKEWLGLSIPKSKTGKHDSSEITPEVGYGIVSVKLIPGDRQLVKVYRTAGVVDRTTYSSCGETVTFNNEGDYKVKDWTLSKKKTTVKDTKADYPAVKAGGDTGGCKSGYGPSTVTLKTEKAIFILLERDKVPTVNPEHRQDSLHAYELNYAYPIGGATEKQERLYHLGYTPKNFVLRSSDYKKESSGNTEVRDWHIESSQHAKDDKYKVVETLGGSADGGSVLVHRYRAATGKFDLFTLVPKLYAVDGAAVEPRYSYTIRRTLWEPELKLCSYVGKADCSTTSSAVISNVVSSGDPYMTGILQYSFESSGATTSADISNGTEKELSNTMDTDHLFTAKAYNHWEERTKSVVDKKDAEGNILKNEDGTNQTEEVWSGWEVKHEDISVEMLHYTITHHADKYRTNIIGCVANPKRGEVDSLVGAHSLSDFKEGFARHVAVSQRNTAIKIYPEVQMLVWYETDLYNYAVPTKKVAYVMGEYKREASPAALHGYFVGYTNGRGTAGISINNSPVGTTILESAATGSIAENAYSSVKGNDQYNGSTAMGTTFNTAVTNRPALVMFSAVLSVDSCGHPEEWGSNPEDADASHQAYVSNFEGTETELYMNIEGFSDEAYLMSYTQSDKVTHDQDTIEVPLEFYQGEIQKGKSEAISALETISAGSGYTGDQLWELWGVEDQIKEMFEDINDSDNHSGDFCHSQSDAAGRFSGKWYDEETSHLRLKFYRTETVFGQIYANDKVDYNMLPQDARSRYLNRGGKLTATFHVRFWLGKSRGTAGALNVDIDTFEHNGELRCDEVQKTRFIIDNLTTAEMKK